MTDKEAIEELKARKEHYEMGDGCEFLVEALEKGIKALENQKTGHWIRKNDICTSRVQIYQYECSNCKEINTFDSNYCPYCGAKMGGKKNE